jgi:hypothetical protein
MRIGALVSFEVLLHMIGVNRKYAGKLRGISLEGHEENGLSWLDRYRTLEGHEENGLSWLDRYRTLEGQEANGLSWLDRYRTAPMVVWVNGWVCGVRA